MRCRMFSRLFHRTPPHAGMSEYIRLSPLDREDSTDDEVTDEVDLRPPLAPRPPSPKQDASISSPSWHAPPGSSPLARAAFYWSNYRLLRLLPSLVLMLSIWFATPPGDLTPTAVHLFAVFVAIILAFLTQPFAMSTNVRPFPCPPHTDRTARRSYSALSFSSSQSHLGAKRATIASSNAAYAVPQTTLVSSTTAAASRARCTRRSRDTQTRPYGSSLPPL